tara:strand:- start:124 stop:1230 length:1107 start_codon:yes stop_codon:yes gene_type:complete
MALLDGLKNYIDRKAMEDSIRGSGGMLNADQYALLSPAQQKALRMQGYEANRLNISQPELASNYQAQQQNNMLLEQQKRQKEAMDRVRANPNTPPSQADLMTILGAKDYLTATMGGGTKDTADIRNFNFRKSLSADDQTKWDSMKNQDPLSLFLLEEAKRKGGSAGGLDLTPLEKKIDENFATTAADYVTKGRPQVEANLLNLADKLEILQSGELNVSGPEMAFIPERLAPTLMPGAVAFEDDVRDIVFQSLREKLGAQFTEKEGDRLVAAAFNKNLSEQVNVARLKRLQNTIKDAAQAKENAITYYNSNSTLKGYESTPLDFDSILNKIVSSNDYNNLSDEQLRKIAEESPEEVDAIIEYLKNRENK